MCWKCTYLRSCFLVHGWYVLIVATVTFILVGAFSVIFTSRNSKLARGQLHSLQNRNYDNVYHKNTKLRAKTALLVEKKYSFQNSQNLTQTPTCLKCPHTLRVQQACEHCRPQRFNACVFLSPANQIVEGIVFSRVCLFTGGSHVTITHDDCTRTLPPDPDPHPGNGASLYRDPLEVTSVMKTGDLFKLVHFRTPPPPYFTHWCWHLVVTEACTNSPTEMLSCYLLLQSMWPTN